MAAITGGVTTNIMLHDFDGTQTEGDSFGGIVPTQRVKVSFDHSKTEYNTAILGGSYTGSFDVNLISFSAFLLNSPPLIGVSLPPPSGQTLTTLLETDSATNRIDSTTFRVEEDWANLNQVKYLVGEYVFQYSDGTNTITDYVRKTVDLNFRTFDTTNIDFERLEDNTGSTITEGVCNSYTGFLYPIFSSNLTGEYTQGLVTYDTKGGMKEENNHVNTNIAQSDTPIVSGISPVNPINLNDEFQFGVDLSELNPNQSQYCFNTVLIFEGTLATTTCDCIDVELAQTLVTSNAVQNSFDMAFTLSGGITAGEVDNIEFLHNGTITGTSEFNGTLTGTINVILPTSETYSEYTVIINRTNGCNYSKTFSLLPVTVTESGSTCPQYCTICFTSPDPTGSNIGFQAFGGTPNLGSPSGGLYVSGETQLLIDDISAYLDTNGYSYDHVEVLTNTPGGSFNDVCIYSTDLPLGVIEILYEDYGVQTGVQTSCLTIEESTVCTIQWNGVLVEGNAFLEYSDGTNVGLIGGYTGAQVLTLGADLKADAISRGFTAGVVTGGINGNGFVDFVTIGDSNIPENYYRIRWATAGASVYGTRSACVTT
jgi:hypothetical protein